MAKLSNEKKIDNEINTFIDLSTKLQITFLAIEGGIQVFDGDISVFNLPFNAKTIDVHEAYREHFEGINLIALVNRINPAPTPI
jgi:hypothetical protein